MSHYDLENFNNGKAFIHQDDANGYGNRICINTKGEKVFELPNNGMICYEFENKNVTDVHYKDKIALINAKGEFLTDFIYNHIACRENFDYCEGLKDRKYGVINVKGEEIIPCVYDDCYDISNEYAVLCLNGKWGISDLNNNTIIPFIYEGLFECYNGLIPAKLNNKWGLINLKNEVVIDFIYDELFNTIEETNGVYIVQKEGKYGLIDKNNNKLEDIIYDEYLGDMELYAFKKDDKFALYSSLNRQFISDFIYETDIKNKKGKTIYHNNFGLMDIYGKSAIKLDYDEFFEEYFDKYSDGVAIITKDKTMGAIDKNWNLVIPFDYYKLSRSHEGFIRATKFNGSEGYIDKNNNILIPFGKYDNCRDFHDGFAIGYSTDLNRFGYIDKQGNMLELKEIEE